MEIRFDGKRALVTGAGKGIGRGVAIRLAECGAEVVAVTRTQSDLDELVKINPKIRPLCLDVGDWEATKTALQDVGPIDLLVNNAAVASPKKFDNITEEEVDVKFNVNIKAAINISQEIAKGMKARGGGGAIVNVSSIGSFRSAPSHGTYGCAKAALDQLSRCMAAEYGPYNIRVNAVNPTAIRTRMAEAFFDPNNEMANSMKARTPIRRFGEVDEVVYPILFLLSDKASLITGVVLPVDGGLTVCI